MKLTTLALGLALVASLLPSADARACTTFLLEQDGQRVVGKSYDWDNGLGMVVVNKRGVAKQGLPFKPTDRPPRWVSKYGSVTFNQYGRELPNGGMNEAGLVVEIMWLRETRYPPPDARESLNEVQWIQYQLDNFATVKELVAHAPKLRISAIHATVHYLACDKTGDCAALEYLGGKLVVHHGAALPVNALTNDTYASSLTTLKQCRGFGGKRPLPPGQGSLARFIRASAATKAAGDGSSTPALRAFEVLRSVDTGDFTKWNIVYEPDQLRVHWRSLGHPQIKSLKLADFDLSCATPAKTLDINQAGLVGDVAKRFADYSDETNRRLVTASFARLGLELPKAVLEALIRYPGMLRCAPR